MKHKTNAWKITSIIFIIVFIVVIIGGLFRAHSFRPNNAKATESQIENVKTLALNDLRNRGEDITNLSYKVSDKIRDIDTGNAHKNIIEISLYNATIRHNYIVDVDLGNILVYSKTEFNDGVDHSRYLEHEFPDSFKR